MTIKLYYTLFSPPARAALFAVKNLNIPHELEEVNLIKGETRTSNYEQKNPQHSVPTLEDDDFILWDSHAINAYLVNQYAKDDSLYPKDPKKRAVVDQRLHFDTGTLFPRIQSTTRAVVREKRLTSITQEIVNSFEESYDFVEKFLKKSKYAAGDHITIADYSFVTSLTTMNCLVPIKLEKYALIHKYLELCQSTLQFYDEINGKGIQEYRDLLQKFNFQFMT